MGSWFISLDWLQVMTVGVMYFSVLYFTTALVNTWLSQRLMPAIGFGRRLDPRPLRPGQLRREIGESMMSILIFGTGLVVPWGLLRLGWAQLATAPSVAQIIIEIIVLFFWNELHFYLNHRLLHTRLMRRFHVAHHRSHVATPFSTYAFHPVEAAMLGSVPLIPMLLHDFSFAALASLPVISIVLNSLGHANYEYSRSAPARGPLAASRRHHLHHACYHGNYGFLLPVFDQLFGTGLPLDAADDRIAARGGDGAT
ncbi:sterol desaturase family protein [Pseudoxanthomonas dokdonensis]|uniref:Desaturase n=1 Tax=Pseudoxanthomonas dokdonensis TaxID=344882 RepID=A0A0R0CTP6_9GAMM|nr:sterol desaturase family protein [Pseudoxanthomonas dokdonensis]KRG69105.1 desaturase [Pseudoxanthomonas dokdonensis]